MTKAKTYASPPCMAAEVDPAYFDPLGVDPEQARDVARWRRAERIRLARLREGLGQAGRAQVSDRIGRHLARVLSDHGVGRGYVLSGYWPIKGEPDLRPVLAELHRAGVIIALPVVETRAAPLVFRRWTPETKLVRGDWNIPVPPPEAESLIPDIALAPCLGWDDACYRLGWGGGYYDRTLAALRSRPRTIGIALCAARLGTIYPQPHDIPLDLILTEEGIAAQRSETSAARWEQPPNGSAP
jgi:5,10-methenyltetrahydrofolate synthetase